MGTPLSRSNPALKLKKNMRGLSDASLSWCYHCEKGLLDKGFKNSIIDPFLLYKEDLVVMLCANGAYAFGTSKEVIKKSLII